MEEFVVYILYSKNYGKTYVGFTSNLIERIKSHNVLGTKGYTINIDLGQLLMFNFFYQSKKLCKWKNFIKRVQGRELIKQLIAE